MPNSVQNAVPNGVLPQTLCTAFTEERAFLQIQSQYHDGTAHRRQLAQTSRRTFKLAKRLASADLATLKAFYDQQQGGITPFFFYNPWDGTQTGSNYDSSSNSTVGRYTVVFRGGWQQTTALVRTNIPQLELIEVA